MSEHSSAVDPSSTAKSSSWISRWFHADKLPRDLQKIVFIYTLINLLFGFGFHITDTFLTLFLIEKLSWIHVSLIFSVQMGTQLIFDYPTGTLGDYLGQRVVLISAFLLKMASLVLLLMADGIGIFLIYGFLAGLGNSQLSGTLDSWFDAKYKTKSGEIDINRSIYSLYKAKLYAVYIAVAGFACLISGIIGTLLSRELLFIIEIAVYGGVLFLILKYISPKPKALNNSTPGSISNSDSDSESHSWQQYVAIFKKGIQFASSSPAFICFFLGFAIFNGFMDGVWTKLVLFPFYNAYAVTDLYTGLIRWILLTTDIFFILLLKKIPAQAKSAKKGYLLSQFGIIIGLIVLGFYYVLNPPSAIFQLGSYIGLILFDFTLGIPYRLSYLFFSKMLLDLIPNEIRNSVYSLLPTLALMINIPAALLGGTLMDSWGIPSTILMIVVSGAIGVCLQTYGLVSLRKSKE